MTKNKMMRVASALLVAVLLTTCAISGTFAKYVTSTDASDSARVAYWGFVEPTNVTWNPFLHNDTDVLGPVDDVDLLAPGTEGEATLTLAYTANGNIAAPEVAYSYMLVLEADGDYTALDNNTSFVWKLDGVEYQTFAELKDAVEDLSQERVDAGNRPAAESFTFGWEWKFDENNDVNDTAMGNATDLANIEITLTITATQLND
jgi:hypothetical protein